MVSYYWGYPKGTALYSLGMKGKRIAIVGKNRYEWTLSYLANLLGGIVAVPLDKDLQYDELENSLVRSKADCILFDEKLTDKMDAIRENKKTNLSEFICMSEIEGYKSVKELIQNGEDLISKGIKDAINGKVNNTFNLDIKSLNRKSLKEFYNKQTLPSYY